MASYLVILLLCISGAEAFSLRQNSEDSKAGPWWSQPKFSFSGPPWNNNKYCTSGNIVSVLDANCRQRCASDTRCKYYSFWPDSNWCHTSTSCTTVDTQNLQIKVYEKLDSPPGGSGDPHVVNVNGEHFEVFQLGEHTLVHHPRFAPVNETLLDVKVTIAPCNYDLFTWNCNSRFIETVNVSGSLIGEKNSVHFFAGKLTEPMELLTVRTGDGNQWHHERGLQFDLHSSKYGPVRMTATTGKTGTGLKLHVGDAATIFVQSKQNKFKNSGNKDVHWLDVTVRGLQNLGGEIGGLLGLDDHTKASAIPAECIGLKKKMLKKKAATSKPLLNKPSQA